MVQGGYNFVKEKRNQDVRSRLTTDNFNFTKQRFAIHYANFIEVKVTIRPITKPFLNGF